MLDGTDLPLDPAGPCSQVDADTDEITKTVDYTIGLDEIAQTTTPYSNGQPQAADTVVFGHDGHGSVRMLFDMAAALVQFYYYDAYGQMLAVHNSTGGLVGTSAADALTTLLYSGEQFDSRIGQQYLRARYYNPATGTFNRLDPFFGNLNDPQSLHKYLYTHGDPVNGIDPTGEFSLSGMLASIGISSNVRSMNWEAQYAGRQAAMATLETGLEVVIGKLISLVTGVPFDIPKTELWRSFRTNFASNLVTAGIGNKTKKAIILRNLLDFSIRTFSDVFEGRQNVMWAAAVNLTSLAASGILLARHGKKLLGECIGRFGGCFVAGTEVVVGFEKSKDDGVSTNSNKAAIATERKTVTRPIETIELGSRAITDPPAQLPIESEFGEPVKEAWATIKLIQHRKDGTEIKMELLRPKWWIHLLQLEIGSVVEFPFPELDTVGCAMVLSIGECPPIEEGEGRVVIGRFVTERASNLLQVILDDGSIFTGTTTHPVWSVDDSSWRPLEDFAVGDTVKMLDGEARIDSLRRITEAADVFNVEVDGDHVYRLLPRGVLVHNANYAMPFAGLINGTGGLLHSFNRHAGEWFGRHGGTRSLAAWQNILETVHRSNQIVPWSLPDGVKTWGKFARIDGNKPIFIQFFADGPRKGELATAFMPNRNQEQAIFRLLNE